MQLLDRLESSLESIDLESFASHSGRALFLGRPLALVRAFMKLELRDDPALDQSWTEMSSALKAPPNLRGFLGVQFPVRLGDTQQMNDGLAEFWVESPAGLSDRLADSNYGIIWQVLGSGPTMLSILMDPRAMLHATSGILPTKAISIPADFYADALKKIQLNKLTAPLLTLPGRTILPLPSDPGMSWKWLQRDGPDWVTIYSDAVLEQPILDAFPENGDAIWAKLAESGWILLFADGERALVQSQQTDPDLGADLNKIKSEIKLVIDTFTRRIEPASLDAVFGPRQEIREGYLQFNLGY